MSTQIYIARHASPDWHRTDIRYDVPPGPPLTERGEQEAMLLGEFLMARDVGRVYASPMLRASRTAELAAGVMGLSAQIDHRISEHRKEETGRDVSNRLRPFWVEISTEAERNGPVCFVTHGGPMKMLLYQSGMPEKTLTDHNGRFDHGNPAPPAGAWLISRDDRDEPWTLTLGFSPPHNEDNYA
jgi:broad specificity phosphatase PhoE